MIAQRVRLNGPNKGLQAGAMPAADTTNYRPWRTPFAQPPPRGGVARVKIVEAARLPRNVWPDVTRCGPGSWNLIGGALIDWPCCLPRCVDPETVLLMRSMTGFRQGFLLRSPCFLLTFLRPLTHDGMLESLIGSDTTLERKTGLAIARAPTLHFHQLRSFALIHIMRRLHFI